MDIDNINISLEEYLTKYYRFLSKDIYISTYMYDKFINKYSYLYDECLKNVEYYKDNINYQKILKIRDKKNKFIKSHNKKYLKEHLKIDKNYFDNLYSKMSIDIGDREILLIMDNLVIDNKNDYHKVMLIVSKIRYLIDKQGYRERDIKVIINNKKILNCLNKVLDDYKLNINVYLYNDIRKQYCTCNKVKLISDKEKYEILENYFKKYVFKNKVLLREYIINYKYLYFNKDIYDYDTINDYHNYMFTRKYIQSGISKKDYLTRLIEERRSKLITLNNEKVNYIEEVDIANYLYLNNVRYKIIEGNVIYFKIGKILFYYTNMSEEEDNDNTYYKLYNTYKEGTLLSHLKKLLYSNNINTFVMDKDILKNKIKKDCSDVYYKKFINMIVIPYIDNNLDSDKLLDNFKKYYFSYIKEHNLIDNKMLVHGLSEIPEYRAKYMIMDSEYIKGSFLKLVVNN